MFLVPVRAAAGGQEASLSSEWLLRETVDGRLKTGSDTDSKVTRFQNKTLCFAFSSNPFPSSPPLPFLSSTSDFSLPSLPAPFHPFPVPSLLDHLMIPGCSPLPEEMGQMQRLIAIFSGTLTLFPFLSSLPNHSPSLPCSLLP